MKKKDFLSLIEKQSEIIHLNISLMEDLRLFHSNSLSLSEREVIDGNWFFNKFGYMLEREIILNYSYLFSNAENDFFRLPKSIGEIIKSFNELGWINSVDLNAVNELYQTMNSIIASDKVKTIRDKAVAHQDNDWQTKIPAVNHLFLEDLNSLCKEINDKIFRNLSNKIVLSLWNNNELMSLHGIINKIVELKKYFEVYYSGENYGKLPPK